MPDLIGQRLQVYPTASLFSDAGNVLDPNSIVGMLQQIDTQLLLSVLEASDLGSNIC